MTEKPRILVLCTGNSARSQMAEGLLNYLYGEKYKIDSAGTHPNIVRSEAIAVMAEIGIDISGYRSKSVDEFAGEEIDFVLTVCDNAKENCPYFTAKTRLIHHAFKDPADVQGEFEARFMAFREIRDKIEQYIKNEFALLLDITNF